jgi:hypothetical protein
LTAVCRSLNHAHGSADHAFCGRSSQLIVGRLQVQLAL